MPIKISVAQFEHCQSTITNQISSELRLLEENQEYKTVKDNLDSLLQKRTKLMGENQKKWQKSERILLSFEGDICSNNELEPEKMDLVSSKKFKTFSNV